MNAMGLTLIVLIALVLLLVIVFLRYVPIGLWIRATSSGVKIKISTLIGMRLRRMKKKLLLLKRVML